MVDALSGGSQCWFVTENDPGYWSRRLEWYLRFQPLRSQKHISAVIDDRFVRLCDELAYDPPRFQFSKNLPLFISCEKLLPTDVCVVIPEGLAVEEWSELIKGVWSDLNKPNTRVFLPVNFSEDKIRSSLGNSGKFEIISSPNRM